MNYKQFAFPRIDPKVGFYYSKGRGRDGYIVHDSGGQVAPLRHLSSRIHKTLQYWHPPTQHRNPSCLNLNKWPKTWHYPPDGTGRDRYIKFIKIDEGGLKWNATTGGLRNQTARFMNQLRTYNKSNFYPAIKKQDYFAESQLIGSPKTRRQMAMASYQALLQRRKCLSLSKPKQVRTLLGSLPTRGRKQHCDKRKNCAKECAKECAKK